MERSNNVARDSEKERNREGSRTQNSHYRPDSVAPCCLSELSWACYLWGWCPLVLPVSSLTTMYKRVAHVIRGLPISPWNLPFLYVLIQQFPATRTAGVLSASMYGVDASLPQHTQKQPSTSARWELVDKLPNSLTSLVDYEACSTLSPIVSQVDWAPVAHSSMLFSNISCIGFFSFAASLSTSLPVLPRIASHANYLHSNPWFKVCFWGNPN